VSAERCFFFCEDGSAALNFSVDAESEGWVRDDSANLGGSFYDYFRNQFGVIVGLRFWANDISSFSTHQIWRRFEKVSGIRMDPKSRFVDFYLVPESEIALSITIDGAQDFGGESVWRKGGKLAIRFDLHELE
jgi:hypothetical protein